MARPRTLIAGEANGEILELDEPQLLRWIRIRDRHDHRSGHPQVGQSLVGKIVMMTVERIELCVFGPRRGHRDGTAPATADPAESDEIIMLGAIVADEICTVMPILLVDDVTYRDVASLTAAQITADGQIDPADQPTANRAAARSSAQYRPT